MCICWCQWGSSSGKENTDAVGRREGIAGAQCLSPDSVRDWRGWSCREPGQFAWNSGEKAECLDLQVGGWIWKFACDSSQLALLGTLAEAPSVTGPDPVPSKGTPCSPKVPRAPQRYLTPCPPKVPAATSALCRFHPHSLLFTKHRDRWSNISAVNTSLCVHLSFSAML